MANFTSGWVEYRARRETGDSRLWRQYRNACLAISLHATPQLFFFRVHRKKTVRVDENILNGAGISEKYFY